MQPRAHVTDPLLTFSKDEFVRISWLRSVEWLKWPVFISQPLIPVLIAFFPIWQVAVGIVIIGWLWLLVRSRYVNYSLMRFGALWVRLKWPLMIVMAVYFGAHHEWGHVVLSILTPLAILPLSVLVPPGQTRHIQMKLWESVGFDPVDHVSGGIKADLPDVERGLEGYSDYLEDLEDVEDQPQSSGESHEPLTLDQLRQRILSRKASKQ
jgi:hypothetical protein